MIKAFLKFLWKNQKGQILFIAGLLVVAFGFKYSTQYSIRPIFDTYMNPIFGAITIFLAAFIWFNGQRKTWKNNLPKLLSVAFQWEGKTIMFCKNADLSHESDTRAWAQQIGKQMSGDYLEFNLRIQQYKENKPTKNNGCTYMQYYTIIYLNKIPDKFNNTHQECIDTNKTLVWDFSFEENKFHTSWKTLHPALPNISKLNEVTFSET